MKKKVKVLLIVIIILTVFGLILSTWLKKVFNGVGDVANEDVSPYFNEYEVKRDKLVATVKGNGTITSFNIQKLDISYDAKIKDKYVNDGDMVTTNKVVLRVLQEGYYKDIVSSIDGMFFEVVDNNGINSYYVYNLNNIGVEMLISEKDVAKLTLGQKAAIKITTLNKIVEGSVVYISKLPSEGSKFKVRVNMPYSDDIRFGYGTSVNIYLEEKENVLNIPYNALLIDNDDNYYVVKENCKYEYYRYKIGDIEKLSKDCKTKVEIGIITSDNVEIISGLNEKDIVLEWSH